MYWKTYYIIHYKYLALTPTQLKSDPSRPDVIDVSDDVLHRCLPLLAVWDEVAGVEVDHDDAPRVPDHPEDPARHCTHCTLYTLYVPVRHVPVVVIESPRAAVGEDDRGGGGLDGVHHGLAGHVGDVDLECSRMFHRDVEILECSIPSCRACSSPSQPPGQTATFQSR